MPLSVGTRLGPYEIIAAIGAGGMGEVYKARDTRLDRIVAIKVLPPTLAARSAASASASSAKRRRIAALNHPHICTLYDIGTSTDGVDFLVHGVPRGRDAGDRLAHGRAAARRGARRSAIEIADALDKAHRAGHRPPRSEARQHHAHEAPAPSCSTSVSRRSGRRSGPPACATALVTSLPTSRPAAADRAGHDPRHVAVHGAGTARGRRGRRALGHLRVRRGAATRC